ncbi:MAG: DUF5320 domain-containing protein [Bacteroidales bacterium]|nr:DUF5320 domain-containing protein [Bacteroidales bacterium]
MPGGDKTGPAGAGPMTGRAMGYCAGYSVPGYANMAPGMGRGMARRFGFGRGGGFRRRFYHPGEVMEDLAPTREEELQSLKTQAERLKRTLDDVQRRIDELEKEK